MDTLPTVKVNHPEIEGDFMVINEADFVEGVHVRFGEKPPSKYEGKTAAQLEELAAERKLEVKRLDGKDAKPRVVDFVAALEAADAADATSSEGTSGEGAGAGNPPAGDPANAPAA